MFGMNFKLLRIGFKKIEMSSSTEGIVLQLCEIKSILYLWNREYFESYGTFDFMFPTRYLMKSRLTNL